MFSLKEGLEKAYEGEPLTKMERIIKRAREYCRSCRNFQELIKCLNLTDSEVAELKSASSLSEDDIALIISGYMPSILSDLELDSQELKRMLEIKVEKIYSEELRREFYKLRIRYLATALDEAIIRARLFGNINVDKDNLNALWKH